MPCWSNVGLPATTAGSHFLQLPFTKTTTHHGAKIMLCRQNGESDPIRWLMHHGSINRMDAKMLIFAYRKGSGYLCLTRQALMRRCNEVWGHHGIPAISGHSFRIGGTTELLLCGVPPDVVKMMGRWKSDAFLIYWCSLDIIAPLHSEFVTSTIT